MSLCTNPWITIKARRNKNIPEIQLDKTGLVYIDGKLYDPDDEKYRNLSINVETHSKLNTGEETQKMLELQKEAVKGKTLTVSESKDKDKHESTTIKF
ncbi:MAG: hypothetical protein GX922_03915 [Firmicutes bacterium]|nr:hypothetical protein [Bacillota bacterium]